MLAPSSSAVIDRPVPVAKLWPDSTIVCLGSGPSLTRSDLEFVKSRRPHVRAIAINTTYTAAPWADVLYAADLDWWTAHPGALGFCGLKFSIEQHHVSRKTDAERMRRIRKDFAPFPDVHALFNTGAEGLESDPSGLRTGSHSGAQAINLAAHLGGRRIVLLGYDCQGVYGRMHWHTAHPSPLRQKPSFNQFILGLKAMVPALSLAGIEVINASRETALRCFPRLSLEQALEAVI